jgi:hypothetical protein
MTYYPDNFKGYLPFNMVKCTKMVVFRELMEEINKEKEVIIAVIENFRCDAVTNIFSPTSELIASSIETVIGEIMGVVKNTAARLPETRFSLAQPILRPKHDWYTKKYDGFCRSFVAGTNSLGLDNVAKIEAMPRASQFFAADKVHLTKESSKAYVNGLFFNSDSLFMAELVNLEAGK